MGGLDTEITDATTTVVLEIAWFQPLTVMQTAARLGLRSEASARYERGCDPYVIDTAIARFAELLRETCPELVVHAGTDDARGPGLPPEQRRPTCGSRRSTGSSARRSSPTTCRPLLDPDRLHGVGRRRHAHRRAAVVASRQRRGDRRRRGGRPALRLRPGRQDGADLDRARRADSSRQQRRRLLRQVLLGLGISEAMPNPFLAPDTQAKAGIDDAVITITNPLVDEESVLRTSLRPGLLSAIAFNESHRRIGARLFEIGHVYPPGTGELPDEHEALCVVLAGEEAPAAMAVWREISAALGVGARIDQGRVPAGLHATRSATLQAGKDPTGAVGEVDPAVLARFDVDRAGGDPRARPRRGARPRAQAGGVEAGQPASVERSRPGVRGRRRRARRTTREGDPPGRRQRCWSTSSCSTCSAPSQLGEGRRSLAYRLRLQAPDRNLTDADIAEVRRAARQPPQPSSAPICEADDDAGRTRPRPNAGVARRRSNARACSRSSPATGRGCGQKAQATIQEDEGLTHGRHRSPTRSRSARRSSSSPCG